MNGLEHALEVHSLVKFHYDSSNAISEFIKDIEGSPQTSSQLHLAAAEYAIAASVGHGYDTVNVRPEFAHLAILHYNCRTQIRICHAAEHGASIGYQDMTVFSADAFRMASIIGEFENLQNDPELLGRAARELVQSYVESTLTRMAQAVGTPGKQALIWYLQLSAANYPGYLHDSPDDAIHAGQEVIGLT
ncbi:hypothetical protein GCM10023086_26150 [Streptomyces venetus]|uniref:Uncharacterized protein n=1 Tax=Streptomyces venetus TaxID=1701086 RepID=A0ABP8FNH1_9ACTN